MSDGSQISAALVEICLVRFSEHAPGLNAEQDVESPAEVRLPCCTPLA